MPLLKKLKLRLKILKVAPRNLVVFDLDHTLISGSTSYSYLKILYQKKALPFSVLARAAWIRIRFYTSSMSLENLHHLVFDRLLHRFSLETLEKHLDILLDRLIPGALYQPAYEQLLAAQKRGDYTALLSSAPDFLVRRFARLLGFNFWEGTVYDIDKENCLCHIAKLMVGTQKEKCLVEIRNRLGISKDQTIVYSDSHDDLPLFFQAGTAVAVNPDRKLSKIAKQLKWSII